MINFNFLELAVLEEEEDDLYQIVAVSGCIITCTVSSWKHKKKNFDVTFGYLQY